MSDLVAGNSFIRTVSDNSCHDVLDAVHTDSILNAVNANGINGVQTTENIGLSANATAQRIGLAADATAQRIGNEASATAQRMAVAELDAINDVGHEVCDASRDNIAATERMGLENIHASQRSGDKAVASVERFGLENLHASERAGDKSISATERMGLHNNSAIERTADKTQGTVAFTSDKTQDEVEKFGFRELDAINGAEKYLYAGMSQNAKDILLFNANEFQRVKLQAAENTASIQQSLCNDTKDLLLQACNNTDKILSHSASQFKDILLQNCNDTASIKMQAEIHAKDAALAARDLMHQADKNTCAIQMDALRNKEELARQLAECCCENKALILETSHKTESLVLKLDEQRVRDELAKTREELLALRIRATLPPPPVASISL